MWEILFFYIEAAPPEKRGLSCSRAREVPPKRVSKSRCWSKLVPNWLRCCVSQLNTQTKTLSSRSQTARNVSYRYRYSRVTFWRKRSDFRLSSLEFPWSLVQFWPTSAFWDSILRYFRAQLQLRSRFSGFSGAAASISKKKRLPQLVSYYIFPARKK